MVCRTPSFHPKQNKIYLYLKKEEKKTNNSNQDDDDNDDDDGTEHRRDNIVFLDKKQGWCHVIVVVVPQGATRMVKIEKEKVGIMQ